MAGQERARHRQPGRGDRHFRRSARTSTGCTAACPCSRWSTSWPRSATPTPGSTPCWSARSRALADVRADPTLVAPAFFLKALVLEGRGAGPRRVRLVRRARRRGGAGGLRPRRRRGPVPERRQRPLREPRARSCSCAGSSAASWPPCWRGRRRPPPTRWPRWPPRRWRCTSTAAASARSRSRTARAVWRPPSASTSTCRSAGERCDYCAFATYTDRDHLMERYVEALRRRGPPGGRARAGLAPATSVFFGGGHAVPACHPDPWRRILDAVPPGTRRRGHRRVQPRGCRRDPARRPTAGPGSPGSPSGCSRRCPHVLVGLGRRRAPEAVIAAAASVAAAGFASWNVDLIFGGCRRDRRRLGSAR